MLNANIHRATLSPVTCPKCGPERISQSLRKQKAPSAPEGTLAGGYCSQQRDAYATLLEGAIRRQVNDGPVTTYTAGRSFSELPGDHHNVSANASQTKLAKFLAVFVVETTNTRLTIPLGN
jgi:hypothetical protein